MKNLFLKFISESSNFNQERISFINSIRRNSNLRPFSLINEAPAPAPEPQLGPPEHDGFDRYAFNRWADNTFGRFSDNFTTFNPDTTPDGFMIFDNLMRDLLGDSYDSIPPSLMAHLYNMWGNNLDVLRAFINSNVTIVDFAGVHHTPSSFMVSYLGHFAALLWFADPNNVPDKNNLTAINQAVQTLLDTNPSLHFYANHLLTIMSEIDPNYDVPYGMRAIDDLFAQYRDIIGMYQANGVIFPDLTQINNLLQHHMGSLIFLGHGGGPLPGTLGVPLPGPSQQFPPSPIDDLINAINQYVTYSGSGPLFNATQLQNLASPLGLTQHELNQLLDHMRRVYQNDLFDYNEFIRALLNSQGSVSRLRDLYANMSASSLPYNQGLSDVFALIIRILKRIGTP